ncbi:histidine kinase [Nostocaceae cyanobacterium CENA369]|uniref:histidine kinase n=1 Tax=Dendronalium phyllosphericum CENA369 TaxID=1725256 RepID=A0A8J7HZ53_9NOST|nr:ATP-binding protein [Dendronalium phyllosphericum]MBH8572970.1 histidine kinase [Dendronalium phyllosphericum CENA369]
MILLNQKKIISLSKFRQYRTQQEKPLHNLTTPLVLISSILIIAVIGIASYQIVRGLILQQLQEKALLQVSQGSDELDRWLETRSSIIPTLANTEVVRSLKWSVIEPYLKAEIQRTQEFYKIAVSLPDGSYYNTLSGKANTTNKDRDFIQKALAGKFNISDPFISRTSGIPSVAISAPIHQSFDPASPTIGVLNGSLKVNRIGEIVNKLHYGNGSYAFALNSKGQAIIHPKPALVFTEEKPTPSFLESSDINLAAIARRMVNKEQGIELIPIDGTNKYIAYVPLKQTNWSVALVIPRENIESQLGSLNLLASLLGGLLLITAIMAWRQIQLSEKAKTQVVLLNQQQTTLQQQAQKLEQTLRELQQTQTQLIQKEKMSSLGQLVAGVAHEINNPVSFIYSNITPAHEYTQDLLRLVQLYQQYYPQPVPEIQDEEEAIELNFLMQDLPKLLTSMKGGADRIKQIVLSLRNFSRLDEAEMKAINIHEGIDSTLMILESRLKATTRHPAITVTKEYGDLPLVECYAGQLNQVLMNILVNAIDAIEEEAENGRWRLGQFSPIPQIRIHTELTTEQQIIIRIADNGCGIPETVKKQLFDPFFTTKPIGKGTGLGLSVSYQIITEQHQGKLQCISASGEGAEFVIEIPLSQQKQLAA